MYILRNLLSCLLLTTSHIVVTVTAKTDREEEKNHPESLLFSEKSQQTQPSYLRKTNTDNTNSTVILHNFQLEEDEASYLDSVAERMRPRPLFVDSDSTKQFFHLHHMKSGGTSLSSWISCGLRRQAKITQQRITQYRLSECSYSTFQQCIKSPSHSCRKSIESSSVMTYCAPLAVTEIMDWNDADAITMMRHPVDRVWSMFRFQTKSCFKCNDLKTVYQDIADGNTSQYGTGVCLAQISNHLTRNLLTNLTVDDLTHADYNDMSEEQQVMNAIESIRYRFNVVGVLEQLNETIKQLGYTFPWIAEELQAESKDDDDDDDGNENGNENDGAKSDIHCPFPHRNASPSNNHCGEHGSHWDLPHRPDEETWKLIEEHNQLDMAVYEAALEHFEVQKKAMSMTDMEDIE